MTMVRKAKSQVEADISEAIIKFEKEYMGRGPEETKTYIIGDMVLVRLLYSPQSLGQNRSHKASYLNGFASRSYLH